MQTNAIIILFPVFILFDLPPIGHSKAPKQKLLLPLNGKSEQNVKYGNHKRSIALYELLKNDSLLSK